MSDNDGEAVPVIIKTGKITVDNSPSSTSEPAAQPTGRLTDKTNVTSNPAIVSDILSAATNKQLKKLSVITGLSAKSQKKSVKIKWKKVSGAKGYQIKYSSSKKSRKETQLLVSDNKVNLKKLKPGKTYYIRVRIYSFDGSKKVYGKYSKVIQIKCEK